MSGATVMTTPLDELHELERQGKIRVLDREQGKALVDRQARRYLNMSGDEFIRAWEAGEFDDDPDHSKAMYVAMLIPFAES